MAVEPKRGQASESKTELCPRAQKTYLAPSRYIFSRHSGLQIIK